MLSGGLREAARAALDALEARLFPPPPAKPELKPRAVAFELMLQGLTDKGAPFLVSERFQFFRAGSVHVLPVDVAHLLRGAFHDYNGGKLRNVCVALIGEAVIRGVEGMVSDTAVRSLTLAVLDTDQPLRIKVHVAPLPARVLE